jgi:hypothetical protein
MGFLRFIRITTGIHGLSCKGAGKNLFGREKIALKLRARQGPFGNMTAILEEE